MELVTSDMFMFTLVVKLPTDAKWSIVNLSLSDVYGVLLKQECKWSNQCRVMLRKGLYILRPATKSNWNNVNLRIQYTLLTVIWTY